MDAFISTYVWPGLIMVAQSLLLLVALLVFIAYVLLADRKIWAAVQLRRGPNVVGPWGLFQSFADLLKFVFKEPVIPATANKVIFLLAPLVSVTLALATWAVVPLNDGWVIAKAAVAVQLAEIRKEQAHQIEHVRALRVAGQLRALPGAQVRIELAPQFAHLLLQAFEFARRGARSRKPSQFGDFALEIVNLPLASGSFHGRGVSVSPERRRDRTIFGRRR